MKYIDELYNLLDLTIKSQASDLHLSVGHPPIIRIAGDLVPIRKKYTLTSEISKNFNLFQNVLSLQKDW